MTQAANRRPSQEVPTQISLASRKLQDCLSSATMNTTPVSVAPMAKVVTKVRAKMIAAWFPP